MDEFDCKPGVQGLQESPIERSTKNNNQEYKVTTNTSSDSSESSIQAYFKKRSNSSVQKPT